RIFEYFPVLRERWGQRGRSLSGGEQQMLAIARALAGNPDLVMLDEPSQGLAPRLVRELETLMVRLKGEGVTILLVEQNARMALAVSDQVLVLNKGTVVFSGPTTEFRLREAELKGRYLSVGANGVAHRRAVAVVRLRGLEGASHHRAGLRGSRTDEPRSRSGRSAYRAGRGPADP